MSEYRIRYRPTEQDSFGHDVRIDDRVVEKVDGFTQDPPGFFHFYERIPFLGGFFIDRIVFSVAADAVESIELVRPHA